MSGRGEYHDGRAYAEFPLPELFSRGRGHQECRTGAPDQLGGFGGEKKKVGFRSPKPNHPWVSCITFGCQTTGKIVRVMRFQFSLILIGMTG